MRWPDTLWTQVESCLHRVISALPASSNGTCLECGEDVDVRAVERRWQQEEELEPPPADR